MFSTLIDDATKSVGIIVENKRTIFYSIFNTSIHG